MPQRKTLADLLNANGQSSTSDLLKALFPQLESDETRATKGCDCPACQHHRAAHAMQQHADKNKPEAPSAPDAEGGMVQTIAALVVNNEVVSVGHTVAQAVDEQLRVVFRMSDDEVGNVLTADEARILGQALLAAANHID